MSVSRFGRILVQNLLDRLNAYPLLVLHTPGGNSCALPVNELMKQHILFAVPKHKTSRPKKETRRYGAMKIYKPKRQLLLCNNCGNYHDHRTICDKCYDEVRNENKDLLEIVLQEWKNRSYGKLVQEYKKLRAETQDTSKETDKT